MSDLDNISLIYPIFFSCNIPLLQYNLPPIDLISNVLLSATRRPFELRHVVVGNTANVAAGLPGFSLDATQTPC